MKKKAEISFYFINRALLITASFLLLVAACRSDAEKGLIPEKIFSRILYEVHLTDGLLSLPDIHDKYYPRDSLANYQDIAESYGYSKEDMDKTLRYYFITKPKRLIRIYDNVLARLSEMEIMLEEESIDIPAPQGGMWKGAQQYHFAGRSDTSKLYFDHIFYIAGKYLLEYTLTLYPADETLNPCFTYFTCRADSIQNGRRNYFRGIEYLRDGQPHTYSYNLNIPDNLPLLIRGRLLDFENNPDGILRHAKVENISFTIISAAI